MMTTIDRSELIRPDLVKKKYGTASNLAFNEKIKGLIAQGHSITHFGFGQAPFPVIERATEALHKYVGENSYLPVKGIPQLREGICRFHQHYDNLSFCPDQVIVGPGSKELILLLITVFNGDVLLNSPSWTTYKSQVDLSGRSEYTVTSEEKDDWRITPQILNKFILDNELSPFKLLIFTNPCNPTSTAYSEEQLEQLTAVFRKHNVIVVSDEIYARLHFTHNHVSLAKVYPEGTILSSGFSKWASAGGWRMGYQIYPKDLSSMLEIVSSAGSHSYSCAPAPMQYAVAELMSDLPACDEYIDHTTRIMKAVGEFATSELLSVGVTVVQPMAGYYMFPNFEVIRAALEKRDVRTGDEMCELMLEQAKVAVIAGGPAHLRPAEELTVRLCYVNFDGNIPLAESRRRGIDVPLDNAFVKEFCSPVYSGIMSVTKWVSGLLSES